MHASFVESEFTEEQLVASVMQVFDALDAYVQTGATLPESVTGLSRDDVAIFLAAASSGLIEALVKVQYRCGAGLVAAALDKLEA